MLEVTFNAFTTERVFRLGQNDRADDFMAGNLRSQKHFPVRKLRVGEFHDLAAWTHISPFILHLFDLALVSHAPFFTPLFLAECLGLAWLLLEDLMLDLMYYIPSYKRVHEFQVTKEMVLAQKISLMLLEKAG